MLLDFAHYYIPGYSHTTVSTLLLVMTIILGFIRGMKKELLKIMASPKIVIALLPIVFFGLATYVDVAVNLFSSQVNPYLGAFMIRHLLFIFLILQAMACGKLFDAVTKPYYHFMLIVLVTGAILFFFSVTVDGFQTQTLDVGFLKKSGEGNLGKALYSMPYGLGLLITGQNLSGAFGFSFYQYSSYFFEPQYFGFFMVPAFILFSEKGFKAYRTRDQVLMILTASILVLWAHSLTTLSALIAAGLVWLFLRNVFAAICVLCLILLAMIAVIANYDELALTVSLFRKLSSTSSQATLNGLNEIWDEVGLWGGGTLNIIVGDKGEVLSVFSLFFWAAFIIMLLVNILNELLINKNSVFAYVLIFLVIGFFKSIWHHPQSPISIYICLIFFVYKCTNEVTRSLNVKP